MKFRNLLRKTMMAAALMLSCNIAFSQLNPLLIGQMKPGDSVVIVYDVTINNPLPGGTTTITNQGAVTGTNFIGFNTDDPKTGAAQDATVTQIVVCQQPVFVTFPSNQSYCNGTNVPSGTLTWSTDIPSSFSWSNSNPSITLTTGATGTGTTLPTFTATNNTTSPQTTTVTVTATSDADACVGNPQSFVITVQPTAQVTVPSNQTFCNGVTVTTGTLNFTSTTAGTTFTWTNNNTSTGLPASGSGSSLPTFMATNSGASQITSTIQVTPSIGGCPGTPQSFTITVNPSPVVTVGTKTQTVCNGNPTIPVNFSSTVPTNYAWTRDNNTIGGANSGNGNIPSFTAINNTAAPIVVTYTLTATATGSGCPTIPGTQTFTITVNPTPVVAIGPSAPPAVCQGEVVTLTASGAVTYLWSTGAMTASIVVNASGTYTVTGTNSFGCTSTASVVVTVNPLPNVSISGPSSVCAGSNIDLTGSPVDGDGGVKAIWSTSNTPVATVNNNGVVQGVSAGIATITYQYTDANGCVSSTTRKITVNPLPTATISGTATVCQNSPAPVITFTGNSGTAPYVIRYQVNLGPVQVATTTSGNTATVTQSTTVPGLYTYCLVDVKDANGCSNAASGCVTVYVRPAPTATIGGTASVCQGGPSPNVTFTGATGTGPYTFTYSVNGTGTSTVNGNPIGTVSAPTGVAGTFVYRLISVSDVFGCTQTQTGTATITVVPPQTANAGPDQVVCYPNNSATLAANTANPPATGTWSVVSGPSTASSQFSDVNNPNSTFTGVTIGTYVLRWTISNPPCSSSSDDVQIIIGGPVQGDILGSANNIICAGSNTTIDVDLNTTIPFTGTFNITLTSGSGASSTYNWSAPTGGITGIFVPAANFTNTGATDATYLVTWNKLTDGNGCSSTAPSPYLAGQVIITVEPVPTIAAVPNLPNACNGSSVAITVSNPNGVGGLYDKSVSYPAGLNHSGAAIATNQSYGTFNDVLTNTTAGPLTATYTFTPKGPGSQHCVGNSTSINVVVQPAPTVTCPGSATLSTDPGVCTRNVSGLAPTFGPAGCNGGLTTVTYTISGATTRTGCCDASGVFNKGLSTIIYTVKDPAGNTANCTFTIRIIDTELPTISCPSNQTVTTTAGSCTYGPPGLLSPLNATSADNCPGSFRSYVLTGATTASATVDFFSQSNQKFNKGVTHVVWTITDASGNTRSCSYDLTVIDQQAPVITVCPGAQTVTVDNNCEYRVTTSGFDVTATDNCTPPDAQPSRTYSLSGATFGSGANTLSGTIFNKGLTTVTWTVSDQDGNSSQCSFTVLAKDVTPPVITCPGNQTRSTNNNICTYTAKNNEFDATATDNCNFVGGPPPTANEHGGIKAGIPDPPPVRTWVLSGVTTATGSGTISGTVFNKGVTTVTWTATDGSGNTSSCSFTVTVSDTQFPVIACPTNKVVNTDPGQCSYTHPFGNLTWNASVIDNCGTVLLNFGLSGATTSTTNNLATVEGVSFNPGVTLVSYKAEDLAGNISTCTFTVTVIDNQIPVITNCATLSAGFTRNTNIDLCTWVSPNSTLDAVVTENCAYTVTYTMTGFPAQWDPKLGIHVT